MFRHQKRGRWWAKRPQVTAAGLAAVAMLGTYTFMGGFTPAHKDDLYKRPGSEMTCSELEKSRSAHMTSVAALANDGETVTTRTVVAVEQPAGTVTDGSSEIRVGVSREDHPEAANGVEIRVWTDHDGKLHERVLNVTGMTNSCNAVAIWAPGTQESFINPGTQWEAQGDGRFGLLKTVAVQPMNFDNGTATPVGCPAVPVSDQPPSNVPWPGPTDQRWRLGRPELPVGSNAADVRSAAPILQRPACLPR